MSNKISYAGVYGEYNVAVLKNDESEPYYPFGTGYRKNLITDQFFGTILSGWNHSAQSFMQVCRTSTGSSPATRAENFSTMAHNDETWASLIFDRQVITGINVNDNRIRMRRNFIFDALTGTRTYREATIGILKTGNWSSNIQSDLAVSHFVFPNDIILNSGDRLLIDYSLNIVLDYLHPSGSNLSLSGDGYDFGGKIKIMSNDLGILNNTGSTNTSISYSTIGLLNRNFTINSSTYTAIGSPNSGVPMQLFGTRNYGNIGFFGTGHNLSTYPDPFTNPTSPNEIVGNVTTPTWSNFQIDDGGASIDGTYTYLPTYENRDVAGIYLTMIQNTLSFGQRCVVYLLFDNYQTIPSGAPIQFKLRWYVKRI